MKMTLPFKPHVLALICSAGLCAASAGLYIKSRTVEAPVEAQSTQLTVSDAAAVTLPATLSAPPVINRTESYYHNEENCTGNTDSHGSRHTIQYRFNCQPRHYRAGNNRHFY